MKDRERECREHYGIEKATREMSGIELTDWLVKIQCDGEKYSKDWIIDEFQRRLKRARTKFQSRKVKRNGNSRARKS